MRLRLVRLILSIALSLLLALSGVPIDPPTPFVESVDAQAPLGATVAGSARASDISVTLDPIGTQRRGRNDVYARATTGRAGLICRLAITDADGKSDSPDDVTADANGVCIMHFDVPDRKGAVGNAKVKLKVTASQGSPIGSAKQTFKVRS